MRCGSSSCTPQAVRAPDDAVLAWPPPQNSPCTPQVALLPAGCGTPGCPRAHCARLSPSSWTSPPRPALGFFGCSAPSLKSPANSRSLRPSARLGATPGQGAGGEGEQGPVRQDEQGEGNPPGSKEFLFISVFSGLKETQKRCLQRCLLASKFPLWLSRLRT